MYQYKYTYPYTYFVRDFYYIGINTSKLTALIFEIIRILDR